MLKNTLISIGVFLLIAIIVFVIIKKIVKQVDNAQYSKNFGLQNTVKTTGTPTISQSAAQAYAKRLITDLQWFGIDDKIYSELLSLSDENLIYVNNQFVSNFAGTYDFAYSNINQLIRGEKVVISADANTLLNRLFKLLPSG